MERSLFISFFFTSFELNSALASQLKLTKSSIIFDPDTSSALDITKDYLFNLQTNVANLQSSTSLLENQLTTAQTDISSLKSIVIIWELSALGVVKGRREEGGGREVLARM